MEILRTLQGSSIRSIHGRFWGLRFKTSYFQVGVDEKIVKQQENVDEEIIEVGLRFRA